MAAAAAAVIMRNSGQARGSIFSRRDIQSMPRFAASSMSRREKSAGAMFATCISLTLLAVGLWMLMSALGNERAPDVAEFDSVAEKWDHTFRARFAGSEFRLNATVSTGPDGYEAPAQLIELARDSTPELTWADSEGGEGIENYTALRYVAELEFPSPWREPEAANASNASEMEALFGPLPNRTLAAALHLSIEARSGTAEGAAASELLVMGLPVAFGEKLHALTPASDYKCRSEQHGNWLNQSCHVVKRLTEVCLQVQQNESGAWQLHTPKGGKAYGCDSVRRYDPALYEIEPCWGHRAAYFNCTRPRSLRVEITLRSAADPFLDAAKLTRNRFDFGRSRFHEVVAGGILLALGALVAAPVLILGMLSAERKRRPCNDMEPLSPAATRVGHRTRMHADEDRA